MSAPDDQAVLDVARRHGTDVAAVWSGRSRGAVVALRRRVDGYSRGRGHPTRAEMLAALPSTTCRCPRCADWRTAEAEHQRRQDRRREERRRELAASMTDLVGTGEEWRIAAACLGVDADVFFPERGQSIAEALAYCERCPVRQPCLDHALASQPGGTEIGVFGGTSARERRRMRRDANRRTA